MYRVGWMAAGAALAVAGFWALVCRAQSAAERHLAEGYPITSSRGWDR